MLHGLVAAAGAIDNSPPTFVVTPRRCGSGVGGYPTFAELGLTVCGGSTRGMGERVGRAPRSKRLWKAMILDFSLFSTDQLGIPRFQFAEQITLETVPGYRMMYTVPPRGRTGYVPRYNIVFTPHRRYYSAS